MLENQYHIIIIIIIIIIVIIIIYWCCQFACRYCILIDAKIVQPFSLKPYNRIRYMNCARLKSNTVNILKSKEKKIGPKSFIQFLTNALCHNIHSYIYKQV